MTVYVSTGGYSNFSAEVTAKKFIDSGINSIELSGGIYSENSIKALSNLKEKANFQVHNYFPPPKVPFVLNLASQDKEIANLSLKQVERALDCCTKLGANFYSFHAGFLCDLKVNELGKKINKRNLYDRKKSTDLFMERVLSISKKAKDRGINIMIENNVFSESNKIEFGTNPLLMCDPDESLTIIKQLPKNVRILLDVAHLKVSAKSLGFDPKEMTKKCNNFIGGYHLSDNNALSDTNEAFDEKSWFWKYIKKDSEYYSIEVYNKDNSKIKDLKNIVLKNLKNS